jgi:hypothetical protein
MTNPKDGKKDASIQKRDEAITNGNFINLDGQARGVSLLLTAGLTIYLAWRNQYLDALCGACLALAAATSDRLKKIKIGRRGFESEWQTPRQSRTPDH